METKDCGRRALYGSSEVAGVSATGGPVAGVLVAGGSVLALSTVMEVSSCGLNGRAVTIERERAHLYSRTAVYLIYSYVVP